MKTFVRISTIILCFFVHKTSFAQAVPNMVNNCDNMAILIQVDSLKKEFEKLGFSVAREASLSMESEYEFPILLTLRQGTWYRIIFIGDITSRVYEVRIYDGNEKEVMYKKKMWGDVDGNIINYDYIPKFTEHHIIKPVQINKKKKNVCGYFLIFKKIN